MNLSLIDPAPVERELAERREIVAKLITHQAAPTKLPGWWGSYRLGVLTSTVLVGFLTMVDLMFGHGVLLIYNLLFTPATIVALAQLRDKRHAARALAGSHATEAELSEKHSGRLLDDIKKFNAALGLLGRLSETERAYAEDALRNRRQTLLKRQAAIASVFESVFAPCIGQLERDGHWSRAKRIDIRDREHVLALAELVPDEIRAGVMALAPASEGPAALPDPLDEDYDRRFAALQATAENP